jgi:hypothetical protein
MMLLGNSRGREIEDEDLEDITKGSWQRLENMLWEWYLPLTQVMPS